MPVSIAWGNPEQEYLVISFEGQWELGDFHRITNIHDRMLEPVTHRVHILIDIQKSRSLPNGFLNAIRRSGRNPHPKVGKMAMLGMNPFVRAFIDVVRKVQPDAARRAGMRFVGSVEEALAIFEAAGNPPVTERADSAEQSYTYTVYR